MQLRECKQESAERSRLSGSSLLPLAPCKHLEFRILLLAYKTLNGQAPRYRQDLITAYTCNRALCSQSAGRIGERAFCDQTPLLWNQPPVWVQEADNASILKTLIISVK